MPFRPYGGGYGGGRDPLEMLLMLNSLQEHRRASEERRQSQGLDMMMQLAGVLEPAEFATASSALAQDFSVPQAQLEFARSVNKANAKRMKQQAGRGLFNNAGVAQAAPGLTGTPQQRQAAEQAIRTAGAGAEPQDVETYISGARAGLEAQRQQALADEQRQIRQAQMQQERQLALAQREQQLEGWGARYAQAAIAGAENGENLLAELHQEISSQRGPDAATTLQEVQSRGKAIAANQIIQEDIQAAATVKEARARAEAYGIGMNDSLLLGRGEAIIDPVFQQMGETVVIQVPKSIAGKVWESRQSVSEMLLRFGSLEEAWGNVRGRVGGPIVGEDWAQEFFRRVGQQGSPEATFTSVLRDIALKMVRADQGARASDLDLRFIWARMPSLVETFSASGDARVAALRESLEISAYAIHNPAMRSKMRRMLQKPRTAADDRMGQAFQKFGEGGSAEEFYQELNAWRSQRGREFGGIPTSTSQKSLDVVDEFWSQAPDPNKSSRELQRDFEKFLQQKQTGRGAGGSW